MIENPNPSCLVEADITSFQAYLQPAGFEIQNIPAKYLLKPSRFRVGSLELEILIRAWQSGDSELATLVSNPKRMGFARPDKGVIVLKREDPVTEIHELTHIWQDEENPDFTDSAPQITGKEPLTEKLLIQHMVREGIAVWTSFALALGSGNTVAEASALDRLAFFERNKEKKYRNVEEITKMFPLDIKPIRSRINCYKNAITQMGYDAYAAGLFYVNARMLPLIGRGISLPEGLAGIMAGYPDEINGLLEPARSTPELVKISF